jgi:hypothetical protein
MSQMFQPWLMPIHRLLSVRGAEDMTKSSNLHAVQREIKSPQFVHGRLWWRSWEQKIGAPFFIWPRANLSLHTQVASGTIAQNHKRTAMECDLRLPANTHAYKEKVSCGRGGVLTNLFTHS